MAFVTVQRADGTSRELEVALVRPGVINRLIVKRMFDAKGSETHDPIEAVEVEFAGKATLQELRPGDRLTMRVDVNA